MDADDILRNMSKQGEDPVYVIGSVIILFLALVIRYVQKQRPPKPKEDEDF